MRPHTDDQVVLAPAFHCIHQAVGLADHVVRGPGWLLEGDQSDAVGNRPIAVGGEVEEQGSQLFYRGTGGNRVGFGEQDHEFVATHSGDHVDGSKVGAQLVGNIHKDGITGGVSETVIDVLKAVEVHVGDADALA